MDRVESDVSALCQHFLLVQAHATSTSRVDENADVNKETDSNEIETSNGADDAVDSDDADSNDFQMGLCM